MMRTGKIILIYTQHFHKGLRSITGVPHFEGILI